MTATLDLHSVTGRYPRLLAERHLMLPRCRAGLDVTCGMRFHVRSTTPSRCVRHSAPLAHLGGGPGTRLAPQVAARHQLAAAVDMAGDIMAAGLVRARGSGPANVRYTSGRSRDHSAFTSGRAVSVADATPARGSAPCSGLPPSSPHWQPLATYSDRARWRDPASLRQPSPSFAPSHVGTLTLTGTLIHVGAANTRSGWLRPITAPERCLHVSPRQMSLSNITALFTMQS